MVVEHKLFICECNSPDHQVIVSKFTCDNYANNDVYVTVGLIEDLPFFKRLWTALRYVFGRNAPQVEIILDKNKVKKLVACLQDAGG